MPTPPAPMPPVMILCGGMGTRLRDVTELLPKPMVPIGPQPILWHIMKTYAAFGVRRFILCLGYKREAIIDYFVNYRSRATDTTITLGREGRIVYHGASAEDDWEVTLADTGEKTMTGGRVARAARYLRADDREFFMTYSDGLANIDFAALLAHHRASAKSVTVTAVHPAGRYGELQIERGLVTRFQEKPQNESGLINGGFLVLDRGFVERYLSTDQALVLEQEPMRRAVAADDMAAYLHRGFWQCMDTAREHQLLNALWDAPPAPWTERW